MSSRLAPPPAAGPGGRVVFHGRGSHHIRHASRLADRLFPVAGGGRGATVATAGVPRGWRWRTAAISPAYAATLILFVLANRMTTAANAIFLQSAAPLYLLAAFAWLLQEPIGRADVLYRLAAAAGLPLFFVRTEAAAARAPDPWRGNLPAGISGVTDALTPAGLRWQARAKDSDAGIATVAIGNLAVFAMARRMTLPVGKPGAANAAVILLGVFQVGLSYVCVTRALRHVPAFEASTVLLLEPALNPVWVWLLHGERPGAWALAGGAVILGAAVANARRARVQGSVDFADISGAAPCAKMGSG